MKYFIKTFGCQMNVHESEKLAGVLKSLNYEPTDDINNSDVIVFNTCCIRDGVEQKILGNIGSLKKLKKSNPNLIIAVCGCMSQAKGRDKLLSSKFPFIDIIFGTHNIHEFKNYLNNHNSTNKKIIDVWDNEKGIFEDIEMSRDNINRNAWVNINYGCNNFCSYCIVPYVRGRERSRNPEDIIAEIKGLINDGYKYITLLGQNVNSYGNDFIDKKYTFADLLKEVSSLDGDYRVKFMTSHPKDLSEEVISAIANNKKLSKVIHLPIQSGSNEILKAMNRKYTREHYLGLIKMIRSYIPDAYISTDIIVGFPGETDENFMDTYNLINEVRYDGVFAFMFSRRSGTVADTMSNQIEESVKKERIHKLLELSKSITKEKNKESIGKVFNVITVNKTEDGIEALSDSGKTIFIKSIDLKIGEFYQVKINKFSHNKLYSEVIEEN